MAHQQRKLASQFEALERALVSHCDAGKLATIIKTIKTHITRELLATPRRSKDKINTYTISVSINGPLLGLKEPRWVVLDVDLVDRKSKATFMEDVSKYENEHTFSPERNELVMHGYIILWRGTIGDKGRQIMLAGEFFDSNSLASQSSSATSVSDSSTSVVNARCSSATANTSSGPSTL